MKITATTLNIINWHLNLGLDAPNLYKEIFTIDSFGKTS